MKSSLLSVYNDKVDTGVDNEYPTSKKTFRQPCLQMIIGQRTAGKSYLASKILAQAQREKTFNRIYLISPSAVSNKAYFGKYINDEDIFEPTKESISEVIKSVENDRDEFEDYLKKKELYSRFKKDIKSTRFGFDDDTLITYDAFGFLDGMIPEWKYEKEEAPKSLVILDDCLGSPAILQSSGLTKIATLNRHVAPLNETFKGRSACGLAVIILAQTYKMSNGLSRVLRENLSILTLFKNKQQKQLDAIKEELANVVDIDKFDRAYEYATREKFGSLTIDFRPKCETMTFRKNLNELIIFPDMKCSCPKSAESSKKEKSEKQ